MPRGDRAIHPGRRLERPALPVQRCLHPAAVRPLPDERHPTGEVSHRGSESRAWPAQPLQRVIARLPEGAAGQRRHLRRLSPDVRLRPDAAGREGARDGGRRRLDPRAGAHECRLCRRQSAGVPVPAQARHQPYPAVVYFPARMPSATGAPESQWRASTSSSRAAARSCIRYTRAPTSAATRSRATSRTARTSTATT